MRTLTCPFLTEDRPTISYPLYKPHDRFGQLAKASKSKEIREWLLIYAASSWFFDIEVRKGFG